MWLFFMVCGCQNKTPMMSERLTVQCELGKDISSIKGMTWPKNKNELVDSVTIDRPCVIKLQGTAQDAVTLKSEVTFMTQKNGNLSRIKITPLNEELPFDDVVSALTDLAIKLNCSNLDEIK